VPANLTPDYERAERRYREAGDDEQRLAALREMFATVPKHKGTEKIQADLKRRISQFRKAVARKPLKAIDPFHVPRSGAGQAVLVGLPNVGKSSLVAKLTHAPVKIAPYPFTTSVPVPGMCLYEDVQLELVDTPPLTVEHVPGGLLNTIRNADVIVLVVDASSEPLEQAAQSWSCSTGGAWTCAAFGTTNWTPAIPTSTAACWWPTRLMWLMSRRSPRWRSCMRCGWKHCLCRH
jgi:hypothetical protein